MAVPLGYSGRGNPAVEPAAFPTQLNAAGSLVLRRMDWRGDKRGLVRAKKHGTKSGSGAPLRRGFSFVSYGPLSTAFLDIQNY